MNERRAVDVDGCPSSVDAHRVARRYADTDQPPAPSRVPWRRHRYGPMLGTGVAMAPLDPERNRRLGRSPRRAMRARRGGTISGRGVARRIMLSHGQPHVRLQGTIHGRECGHCRRAIESSPRLLQAGPRGLWASCRVALAVPSGWMNQAPRNRGGRRSPCGGATGRDLLDGAQRRKPLG